MQHIEKKLERELLQELEIKNPGKVNRYLSVNMYLEDGRLLMYQEAKTNEIVIRFDLDDLKPIYTPMSPDYYSIDPHN